MRDVAFDAAMDELATEDPERRTRGLHESPSRFLLRTNFQTVARHLPGARPAAALTGAPTPPTPVGAAAPLSSEQRPGGHQGAA